MDKEQIPFPKIDLFPRVTKAAHFLLDQLRHQGLSDHAPHETLDDSSEYDHYETLRKDLGL